MKNAFMQPYDYERVYFPEDLSLGTVVQYHWSGQEEPLKLRILDLTSKGPVVEVIDETETDSKAPPIIGCLVGSQVPINDSWEFDRHLVEGAPIVIEVSSNNHFVLDGWDDLVIHQPTSV